MNSERIERYKFLTKSASEYAERWCYYYQELAILLSSIIPSDASVVQLGSGIGNVLAAIPGRKKMGIELNTELLAQARAEHPDISWIEDEYWNLRQEVGFDYALISEITDTLDDVDVVLRQARRLIVADGRLVIVTRSVLWKPLFRLAHFLSPRTTRSAFPSLLSQHDLTNLLYLAGFEVVRTGRGIPIPLRIPLLSPLLNRILPGLPIFSCLGVIQYVVARPLPEKRRDCSVSVVIAARNERGNIAKLLERIPNFSSALEIIFVEGNSSDGTWEEIQRVSRDACSGKNIIAVQQEGRGKWDAVEKGFSIATGELLMILDADMTVPPEDLPRFYIAFLEGRGEFINGSRLIYPMDRSAMRFLNKLGNLFFATLISAIVKLKLTDTLCGTKVVRKSDWIRIKTLRDRFQMRDPFGDFELLFGAAWLNLRVVDLPVRYRERKYGTTQISRFKDGWQLLLLCANAWFHFRFIK